MWDVKRLIEIFFYIFKFVSFCCFSFSSLRQKPQHNIRAFKRRYVWMSHKNMHPHLFAVAWRYFSWSERKLKCETIIVRMEWQIKCDKDTTSSRVVKIFSHLNYPFVWERCFVFCQTRTEPACAQVVVDLWRYFHAVWKFSFRLVVARVKKLSTVTFQLVRFVSTPSRPFKIPSSIRFWLLMSTTTARHDRKTSELWHESLCCGWSFSNLSLPHPSISHFTFFFNCFSQRLFRAVVFFSRVFFSVSSTLAVSVSVLQKRRASIMWKWRWMAE